MRTGSLWACPDTLAQPCDAWWWVEHGGLGGDHDYEITLPGSSLGIVQVYEGWNCVATQAVLDGATYEVSDDGWGIVGLDHDADGFSVEGGDCDDDDPQRFPCQNC